jgi:ABC-type multidrug transport system fused ATPase/permease subunit
MQRTSGSVLFRGSIAYCQQSAWIQNATLRDNILFGLPFDELKYKNTLKVCCLEHDIDLLPAGDSVCSIYID